MQCSTTDDSKKIQHGCGTGYYSRLGALIVNSSDNTKHSAIYAVVPDGIGAQFAQFFGQKLKAPPGFAACLQSKILRASKHSGAELETFWPPSVTHAKASWKRGNTRSFSDLEECLEALSILLQ